MTVWRYNAGTVDLKDYSVILRLNCWFSVLATLAVTNQMRDIYQVA